MTKTIGRIQRQGAISFGDASLAIWEDGLAGKTYEQREAWERQFKREVFARIVQQLNRLGWTCAVPEQYVQQYSLSFARDRRECSKGELKGWLEISGRTIKFETWQGVNTPTRPDHGGRYEWNKEACMPYLLRLEMERTRRRLRDYLCGVIDGYVFDPEKKTSHRTLLEKTALQQIEQWYAESSHFKGDWQAYKDKLGMACNRRSADGAMLEHGQRVWFFDHHGRAATGIAFYNFNSMWWVVTGRYDYTNMSAFELYAVPPDNLRLKRNSSLRRKRLEAELAKSIKAMNFERAALLRDLIFPKGEQLFVVWHNGHKLFHRSGFRGYTHDSIEAGKFTADEVRHWNEGDNEVRRLEAATETA